MDNDIDTIAALFARDPRTHTEADTNKMIEYYQERRRAFKLSGKGDARIEKPKSSLEDLGL